MNSRILRTAYRFSKDEGYVSTCFAEQTKHCYPIITIHCQKQIEKCSYLGIYPTFMTQLMQLYGAPVSDYTIVPWYDGNNSVFQLLQQGSIDFVGPDYSFNTARDDIASRSVLIYGSSMSMYSAKQLDFPKYSLTLFLGTRITVSIVTALILISLIPLVLNRLNRGNSDSTVVLHKVGFVICFVTINILLNLFGSEIAVRSALMLTRQFKYTTLNQLLNALENKQLILVLGGKSITVNQMYALTASVKDKSRLERIRSNIVQVDTYDDSLSYVLRRKNSVTMMLDRFVVDLRTWQKYCDRFTVNDAPVEFGEETGGFYFSKQHENKTNRFRQFVSRNRWLIGEMIAIVRRRYAVRTMQSIKCNNQYTDSTDGGYPDTVTIGSLWHNVIQSVFLYGLCTAAIIFLLEKLIGRIRLIKSANPGR